MARQKSARERQAAPFPAFDESPLKAAAPSEPGSSMTPFKALIKRLSEAYGPPGSEGPVREVVRDEVKNFVDQVRVDALGNLIVHRRGSGTHRRKVMLAAHLDEVGVMVTFIDARGFARVGALGGVKPATLVGARVMFESGTVGVIGREERDGARAPVEMDALFLDAGEPGADATLLRVGDAACFAGAFCEAGGKLIGKALNNRIGCAVLIETLRQLKKSPYDLFCAFTVQQNVGGRGAGAAAFSIQPDIAFVIDAAAAGDLPGMNVNGLGLGKGPAIKFQDEGALTSASARQMLVNAAREAHVTCQLDVAPRQQGDNLAIQSAREGVPTGVLGIPMRYLHTASEMIDYDDAQNAVKIATLLLSRAR